MLLIVGIDIGNVIIEVVLVFDDLQVRVFVVSGIVVMMGMKGMWDNIVGIFVVLEQVLVKILWLMSDVFCIYFNEVVLVIGDVVMEIIIEIIIIELIMIGYNLQMLGGVGVGVGMIIVFGWLVMLLVV